MLKHNATPTPAELTFAEIAMIAGGMISLYEPGENPNEQPAGQTKSMIAWRYFGDVGL